MTLTGTIVNGVVVLDNGAHIPEGVRVTVAIASDQGPKETLHDVPMKFAGCMTDLPPDMAEQHDHYIHGTPKR